MARRPCKSLLMDSRGPMIREHSSGSQAPGLGAATHDGTTMRSSLLPLAFLASPLVAGEPATHCVAGEEVYFSCAIEGSNKVVSLCGGIGESGAPAWLQYRFGVIGRAELVFPSKKNGSLLEFGGVRQTAKAIGLTVLEVWFRVGEYDYLIAHDSGGDCEGECQEVNNLVIFEHGRASASLVCKAPVVNALWGLYGHISDDQSRRP